MSKGERIWIGTSFRVATSYFGECMDITLKCWIKVDINVKGGVYWHCSVGIDVNRALVLFIICLCLTRDV